MIEYILKRILLTIPVIFGIILIVFIVARSLPGDPITVMFGELEPPPETRRMLEEELGLNQPVFVQFLIYCRRVLSGDWGKSVFTGESVLLLALRRFGATLELALSSILIASAIGLTLGYVSARRRGGVADKAIRLVSTAGFSMPVFWWGLVLIFIFSVYLEALPASGRGDIRHLILPALTLATVNFGLIARLTRACMLETLTQDHVFAARARGLPEKVVFIRHVLRNALIPVFTFIGLRFGLLMGGAVITETVFAYPGLGKMIVDAIFMRDYPVILGGILLAAIVICAVNLIVDVIYVYLDPRIRFERRSV